MDAPLFAHDSLSAPDALVRPWRRATIAASVIAGVELLLLLVAAFMLLAKPLSRAMHRQAEAAAFATPAVHAKPVVHAKAPAAVAHLSRAHTHVYVLNGNGRTGAAAAEAATLRTLGYHVQGAGNAPHANYATTVIMYRGAFRGEALRLGRDLHVKIVGPLDGLRPSALHGGQLAILLGASSL